MSSQDSINSALKADELCRMVAEHAKLKCPTAGHYAWEAGCLTSILHTLAMNHPEVMPTLEKELEWHTKQVKCLVGLGGAKGS